MVASVEAAHGLALLSAQDDELLTSRARPIVLVPRCRDAPVARSVAPRSGELGLMLPYTPLHHLLLADAGTALVMTSGNASDEPIAYRDADALERLAPIADLFLLHDRPIRTRTDDSVVRTAMVAGTRRTQLLRRSRGFVPAPLPVPAAAPLLGCGAELKNTFCLAKDGRAWVGHHVGDLQNAETTLAFAEGIEHFRRLFAVEPRIVAHDLHPEYRSTRYAQDLDDAQDVELVGVQHHHAHLAACLAEHGERGAAVGAIFDGTGFGPDGTIWGGELLVGDLAGFERTGMLHAVRMPGGEAAIRQPWRMACAWLAEALGSGAPVPPTLRGQVDPVAWEQVAGLARTGLASPWTTSAGRLFDAVAALCGLRPAVTYEGQAAVELEAACDPWAHGAYPLPVRPDGDGRLVLDARVTIGHVVEDLAHGTCAGIVAARFHDGVAAATAQACATHRGARRSHDGRALRRRVPEPAPARGDGGAAPGLGPARADARAAAAERRGDRLRPGRGRSRPAGGRRLMFGLDEQLSHVGGGGSLLVVLAVALLLGLRHATDPDHLAAVSTLIASDPEDGTRCAGRLGISWGLGHATTLIALGLPIVLLGTYLPEPVQRGAEAAVGLVIMALALRLLVRWRRGHFHAHLHRHGDVQHRHLHPHAEHPGHAHTARAGGAAGALAGPGVRHRARARRRRLGGRRRAAARRDRRPRRPRPPRSCCSPWRRRSRWPACPRASATRSRAARSCGACSRSRPRSAR